MLELNIADAEHVWLWHRSNIYTETPTRSEDSATSLTCMKLGGARDNRSTCTLRVPCDLELEDQNREAIVPLQRNLFNENNETNLATDTLRALTRNTGDRTCIEFFKRNELSSSFSPPEKGFTSTGDR